MPKVQACESKTTSPSLLLERRTFEGKGPVQTHLPALSANKTLKPFRCDRPTTLFHFAIGNGELGC